MAYQFRERIAQRLAELTGLPSEDLCRAVGNGRGDSNEQYRVSAAALRAVAGNNSHHRDSTLFSLATTTADDLATRLADAWHDPTITAVASGPFVFFSVPTTEFVSTTLSAIEIGHHFCGTDHLKPVGDKVTIVYDFPGLGEDFTGSHWRALAMTSFSVKALKLRGCESIITKCRINMWNDTTGCMLLLHRSRDSKTKLLENAPAYLRELRLEAVGLAETIPSFLAEATAMMRDLQNQQTDAVQLWKELWDAWSHGMERDLIAANFILKPTTDELELGHVDRINAFCDVLKSKEYISNGRVAGELVMNLQEDQSGIAVLIRPLPTAPDMTDVVVVPTPVLMDALTFLENSDTPTLWVRAATKAYALGQSLGVARRAKLDGMGDISEDIWIGVPYGLVDKLEVGIESANSPVAYIEQAELSMKKLSVNDDLSDDEELVVTDSPFADIDNGVPSCAYVVEGESRTPPFTKDRVAWFVAHSAITTQILQRPRLRSFTFSWVPIINHASDSGVFLQYIHARLCNIMLKSRTLHNTKASVDPLLHSSQALSLVKTLSRYSGVFAASINSLEPNLLQQYLVDLASRISSVSYSLRIKDQPEDIREARMRLFSCARVILCSGLRLLGITPATRM
ncbi:Arginyl-tRNA synthetase [Gaertneriomyces sp. JEL0708]|nr:Arginyl-tRNA synthetase [Gaertneriomyces sp. JEL0708]